jgi:hypothetical protein
MNIQALLDVKLPPSVSPFGSAGMLWNTSNGVNSSIST